MRLAAGLSRGSDGLACPAPARRVLRAPPAGYQFTSSSLIFILLAGLLPRFFVVWVMLPIYTTAAYTATRGPQANVTGGVLAAGRPAELAPQGAAVDVSGVGRRVHLLHLQGMPGRAVRCRIARSKST